MHKNCAYYAGIMLNAFGYLCPKLCWHNRRRPKQNSRWYHIRDSQLSEKLQMDSKLTLEKATAMARQSEFVKLQQRTWC